ncbi:MAG TPA: site-specific DNA-methyltransferase [Myxococcota bacterium]|nr:site-specific DNA-methyltransferase [Myxococcota bacterium]
MPRIKNSSSQIREAVPYSYPEADLPSRPEIGAQAHFKKKKAPVVYRFDSSLAPEMRWDEQNSAREIGDALIKKILDSDNLTDAKRAATELASLGKPFLDWAGKAEHSSFEVPTLPLFVHERLSTKAILETLKEHRKDKQPDFFDVLFGSAEHSLSDQVLRAYEHRDQWVNRMVLGDSLVVMNSLLHYESLGGQVQMIYMDPPYGVKFGSNFQPFVRKRDVSHNDDDDMTREPEMVQAYRDTWEYGLHSYLTYLRDRLFLCKKMLAPTGSVFVQISDENVHHVREIMDEVFGKENFVSQITFLKTSGFDTSTIGTLGDYLLWYAKDFARVKVNKMFTRQEVVPGEGNAKWILLPDGTYRGVTAAEKRGEEPIPTGARFYQPDNMVSQGASGVSQPFMFEGNTYLPPDNSHWKANYPEGMKRLAEAGRLHLAKNSLRYRRFPEDFPFEEIGNVWTDTRTGNFTDDKVYVVQTGSKVIQRCILMTTDPGDLVLDPTCGSGTTAFVAEQWGRRWITIDTSRVPLALARQRLLTGTFDYFELAAEDRGPAGGFVYRQRKNAKGEEIGGIVPHITLGSIANNEPPAQEVLVDRPDVKSNIVRVTGPFTFEATIPTSEGLDEEPDSPGIQGEEHRNHVERMIEVLRRAPTLRLAGNDTVTLKQVRPPAKTLSLSAEAQIDAGDGQTEPVAILFGPADGAISERLVREAWDEAGLKHYGRLLVIGYGIDPKAREFVDRAGRIGIPCVYLQASMDLQMGDLLKNMRSSQVFSLCGLPDFELAATDNPDPDSEHKTLWSVTLAGLDTFDPVTMAPSHLLGNDVPAWFLDTDYNGMVFRVRQAFFPRTGAWENLKKALKAEYDDSVWEHLSGTTSAPFPAGEHGQVAVKVIDPRGNELIAIRKLEVA